MRMPWTTETMYCATSPLAPMLALATVGSLRRNLCRSGAAELCSTGVAGTATSCEAVSGLAESLSSARVDRTLGRTDRSATAAAGLHTPSRLKATSYLCSP